MGDEEWKKLSVEDRCVHKVWKARLNGYEEAAKIFRKLDNEKSPEFSKFAGLLKKFALDSNAVAQEKGLDAILAFQENAALAPKTCGEVTSAVVTKCLNSSRAKTKEKGIEILMMYIELEKQEQVVEEVLNGLSNKQPKIVAACTLVIKTAVRDFGSKVIGMKPIVKSIPKLLEHSDKTVREEAKQLAVEAYRWIGPAIKPSLNNIKPVQLKELEDEFEKLPKKPPKQARFLKSQQDLKAKAEAAAARGSDEESDDEDSAAAAPAVDPFDLLEPEEILSKMPKDFYESMEAKKWQIRKEALETILPLCTKPKLEAGDYGDLVKALKKTISKDTNVMIVAAAGKCLAGLGNGLKKKFAPYANLCIQAILEKFKEKKVMVVTALRDAIDAVFPATSFPNILEDVLAALDNKNPSIKAETCLFLARSFRISSPSSLPKTVLKPIGSSLVQKLSDTTPDVREAAMQALGTALRIVGEKPMNPLIADLEKLKLDKIKEYCEKVELPEGKGGAKKSKPKEKKEEKEEAPAKPAARPKTAPAGTERKAAKAGKPSKPSGGSKSSSKPASGGGGGAKKGAAKKGGNKTATELPSEPVLGDEEAAEKAAAVLPKSVVDQLTSSNWKERLAAMEEFTTKVLNMERSDIPGQAFVRFMAKPPGFKDANFQVMNAKFGMIATLAEKSNFTRTSAEFVCKFLVDKIGDVKAGAKAKEAFTAIAEAVTLGLIAEQAVKYAFDGQKNPKNQAETFNWLSQAIQEFGFATINPKPFINYIKTALSAINPQVRTAAVTCIGVMHMYMGANLRMLFEDLKPALLAQIDGEIEKVSGTSPPKPFRGLKKGKNADADESEEEDGEDEEEDGAPGGGAGAMDDLVPREDISGKITDGLLAELNDAKWKIRGEALAKVQGILKEAKFISPNLGELPNALKVRLGESNKILATTTANICQTIATAMGPAVKTHVKTIIPALIFLTSDSKITVRQAAVQALTAWEEQIGVAPFIEDEVLSSALAKEKPFLRMEMFGFLTVALVKYRTVPVAELSQSVPYLFAALEDRNADVRKKAQEALPPFMMHLTYEKMIKMTGKLKPGSKTQVMAIMEKQRDNIPEKPGKPAKSGKKSKSASKPVPVEDEEEEEDPEPVAPPKKVMKRPKTAPAKSSQPNDSKAVSQPPDQVEEAPPAAAAASSKKGKQSKEAGAAAKKSSKSSRKKDDDEDSGPPLLIVGSKERRYKDEQDLKVLKWNFTASRSEYVDQLKEQMQPCFSKSIIHNMYQDDFKFHVQAISTLTGCIDNHKDATVANLDLILKWFTLRFTETNTAVHVKSMDYLQQLFTVLSADDYSLTDYEANAFIPSLIAKVGDNKENIRKGVRKVIKLCLKLYPASKMFVFIMDGLRSKNARQRTECLEELSSMIEVYGLNVCQPSPPKALKEIATQVGDRDNSVRSAALNTLVQAYQIVGEDIYKQVGKLNDKEMALLEERIKRSGKKPAIANKSAQPVQNKKNDKANRAEKKSVLPSTTRPSTAPEQSAPPPSNSSVPAYFSLDLDKLDLEKPASSVELPKLEDTSEADALLDAEIKIPTRSIPKPSMPTEMQLNFMMSQVASNDLNLSIQALAQLDEILKDRDRSKVMVTHVDQLLVATAFQLRMAFSKHMGDEESSKNVIRMYRCLVALLVSLFQNTQLSREASKDVICDLVNGLITVLIDDRLMKFEDGPQVVRSVNVLMAKVVENSDHSNIIGALLKLLHECVATESHSPKFLQLVMKCLWRMVRLMPNIINDLAVDKILLDMHNFLKAFPSPVWKEKSSDTPLRTVKTMLHSLAKILGPKVLTYLTAIPDPQDSELEGYLKKVLKSSQRSSTGNSNEQINGSSSESEKSHSQTGDRTPRRPSAKTNDLLAEIFKKIGSKENTREGLTELYDFKQKYPEVNIDPFLKKTSQFFQSYIEHGLKTITLERDAAQTKLSSAGTSPVITPNPDSANPGDVEAGDMTNYLERIRVLRAKCGFENNPEDAQSGGSRQTVKSTNAPSSLDPNKDSNATNVHQGLYQPSRITLGSSSSLIPSTTTTSVPDNMEDLKKRLEKIKREQKK